MSDLGPKDPPPLPPRPIEYRSPEADASRGRFETRDLLVVALLSGGGTIATGFLFAMTNFQLSGTPAPPTRFGLPLVFAGAVAATLIGIGYHRWKRRGSRAWAAGVLMGFAAGAMTAGLCFASL